ncbi:hypothetical protein FA95DRAFT_1021813 [Auriscalpium vulgare]|uniref:Uncharacterized protein n=1 Tax=Auriscalpium vulgare TaxID=40419 RepID=A0ACB8RXF4_9AGAM|nr:hypothetical protein FA95DRAFT_1021813 [Auriscalpium vulgare]
MACGRLDSTFLLFLASRQSGESAYKNPSSAATTPTILSQCARLGGTASATPPIFRLYLARENLWQAAILAAPNPCCHICETRQGRRELEPAHGVSAVHEEFIDSAPRASTQLCAHRANLAA